MHALVTGANRGLGLEVTRQLAARGFTVWAGARDPGAVPALGDAVRPLRLDLDDADSIAQARAEVTELDVLVNSAGILSLSRSLALDADVDDTRRLLETNAFGPWRVAAAFADLLRASPHGRLVNVSSSVSSLARMTDMGPAYLLSKLVLNGVTRMLADALRADGVLVNAVCPGWIDTDMGRIAGDGGRPVAEGAAAVVWAATLPDDGPTGGFFENAGEPVPW
jgi:NAD(P)-dependent dehydrogenase (short-subunit alcohol dehydrogenase family)